jgi:hypothetical protein
MIDALAQRLLFTVGDRAYTWEDVVLAGHVWGEWAALEREVRAGLACLARLDDVGEDGDEGEDGLGDDELDAAAAEFRYARDLVAADDMHAWLTERGLTVEDWLDHIRRSLALRKYGDRAEDAAVAEDAAADQAHLDEEDSDQEDADQENADQDDADQDNADQDDADQEDVDGALVCDAICGGRATAMTAQLSARAALYARTIAEAASGQDGVSDAEVEAFLASVPVDCASGRLAALSPEACRERLQHLARLEIVWRRFASAEASPRAIRELIGTRWLGWIRVRLRSVFAQDGDTIREIALCVREDRRDLCDVAAGAGVNVDEAERYVDEVDERFRGLLVGARSGDVLGPVALGDGFLLAQVLARQAPSETDPHVRARAERELLARTVDREVQDRVTWHRPL